MVGPVPLRPVSVRVIDVGLDSVLTWIDHRRDLAQVVVRVLEDLAVGISDLDQVSRCVVDGSARVAQCIPVRKDVAIHVVCPAVAERGRAEGPIQLDDIAQVVICIDRGQRLVGIEHRLTLARDIVDDLSCVAVASGHRDQPAAHIVERFYRPVRPGDSRKVVIGVVAEARLIVVCVDVRLKVAPR